MLLLLDPLYMLVAIFGYIILLALSILASKIISKKVLSKFSLYTSMFLVSLSLLLVLSISILIILNLQYSEIISEQLLYTIIIWLLIANIVSFIVSPYLINLFYKTRPSERLKQLLYEISPKDIDKIKIVEFDGIPNAFAYGNPLTGKYIAVSTSLIEIMDKDELKAVIGHELGHHRHRDSYIMLLFGLIPSFLYFFGYFLIRTSLIRSNDRRNSNASLAIAGIILILLSAIAQILVLAFSRLREYYADAYGAKLTNNLYMQSALAKIFMIYRKNNYLKDIIKDNKLKTLFIYSLTTSIANPIVDPIIIDELKNYEENPIKEVLSTHPPISKRLRALDSIEQD